MNPQRLLQHFDAISEAPDAVTKLRRFLLDLAVRGKLVEQDVRDEPASELLKRIAQEKTRLAAAGEIKKAKPSAAAKESPQVFSIPEGWELTTLLSLCTSVTDGDHLPPPKAVEGVPFLVIGNVRARQVRFADCRYVSRAYYEGLDAIRRPRAGDLLYTLVGSYGIPVQVMTDDEFCVQRHIGILRPSTLILAPFLARMLDSAWVFEQATACATGIAQKTVPLVGLRNFSIPLPPLAEQHRIVAKVDELMALCDQLQAARATREQQRDQLVAASLHRLAADDTGDSDDITDPATRRVEHARFHLQHLPRFATRAEHIKQLRQTILNLAVRGRLLPQNPTDEAAISFDKAMPAEVEVPFDTPTNWKWARLSAMGKLKGGGTPSKARDDFWNGSTPWVSPKDMKVDYLAEAQMSITDAAVDGSSVNLIAAGSVLFVVRGMILAHSFPVAISRVPLTINQDMKASELKEPEMAEFLLRALKGLKPEMLARVQRSSHGTCRLEGADYQNFPIPIPPLAEQRRIVAKVDELMVLCDQLEASFTKAQSDRGRLLDSLLHEALAPVDARQKRNR